MRLLKNTDNYSEKELLEIASQNYLEFYEKYPKNSEDTEFLNSIKTDSELLKSLFLSLPVFGTAGVRGKMLPAVNAMNKYTVALITRSVADTVKEEKAEDKGVVIAYDSRKNSRAFAEIAASVLANFGIKVFLFNSMRPTPQLSFAVGFLGCIAGINITASHNTKEYNGYKLYWSDGTQISVEQARKINGNFYNYDYFSTLDGVSFERLVKEKKINIISEKTDLAYMKAVLSQSVFESDKKDVKVVYTALFGTGSKFVPDILEHAGYKNLRFVEEQMVENGDFPGLTKPNPQNKEAFAEAVKLAKKNGSDVILATDPDADRMGMAIRDDNGEYVVLTGNQIGVLLLDFIIKVKKEKGTLSPNAFVVKSLVSTELAADICKKNGVTLENVYTGFKYIGEKITEAENTQREFLFGFEESHGYLTGNYAKDKDGVAACLLAAELAQYHKEQGNTVLEALYNIYNEYGKYTEILHDITVKAVDFKKEIETFISNVRENIPKVLAGEDVIRVFDFLKREEKDLLNNTSSSIMLPSENMLMLETAESKLVLRPSGTEPKLKVYYFMKELDKYKSEEKQKQIEKQLKIDLL